MLSKQPFKMATQCHCAWQSADLWEIRLDLVTEVLSRVLALNSDCWIAMRSRIFFSCGRLHRSRSNLLVNRRRDSWGTTSSVDFATEVLPRILSVCAAESNASDHWQSRLRSANGTYSKASSNMKGNRMVKFRTSRYWSQDTTELSMQWS